MVKLPFASLLGVNITHLAHDVNAHGFDRCPSPCSVSGLNPVNWTTYSHLDRLKSCDRALMVDFSIYAPIDKSQRVRSCAIWGSDFQNTVADVRTAEKLAQGYTTTTQSVNLGLTWWNGRDESESQGDSVDAILTMNEVQSYLARTSKEHNNTTMLFATSGNVAIGIYVGAAVVNTDVPDAVVQPLINQILTSSLSKGSLAQVCGANRTDQDTVGIIATTNNGFTLVQAALRTWSEAKCVSGGDGSLRIPNTTISTARMISNSTTSSNGTYEPVQLYKRADCRTLTAAKGDYCSKLASDCGISFDQFQKYNPGANFCSLLQPHQKVCCTSGTIPKPKKNSDGLCASYITVTGDTCSALASSNGITVDDIEKFNKDTWGWSGCDPSKFWADTNICLSSGTPPMPVTLDTAKCGPQVAGTKRPPAGMSLASLNPCPLNVCCDIWGQCGTTDEFCDVNGPNKCISNCGKDIIKGSAPSAWMTVAYFEGFNLQRDCLNMDVSQVDTKAYTHIHFAFGILTSDFKVSLGNSDVEYEFNKFRQISGPKKILSFGGWDFSTNPNTYMIFRDGTSDAHRQTLAKNMANFIIDNGMDGIDIDWEYPSAPDIPGIPAGDKAEGNHLLKFVRLLKALLPGKSVSIAAPASYWYLKGFPIKDISGVVDYIVYMTYDLHGQWDYGNQWSDAGCSTGNCLRSDVNMTETLNALVMITKAGVPANKVVVGVTSYGRSFKMTTPGCTAESCTYTGSVSGATPGRCTKEPGYLGAAEIDEILSKNPTASTFFDKASQTDILVYNSTQWASYMTKSTKDNRIKKYNLNNFLGSSDWAIDLANFHAPPSGSDINGGLLGLELTWDMFKANLRNSGLATCDKAYRSGTWVTKPCTMDVVSDAIDYMPKQRWEKMDCNHAWSDTMTRWFGCDRPSRNGTFSNSVANFVHAQERAACNDLSSDVNCDSTENCYAHNSPDDSDNAKTGACGYEIWNSLVAIHQIIKNFKDTAEVARSRVLEKKVDFLEDFGNPSGDDLGPLFQVLNPILSLVGGWWFKGALAGKPAFKENGDMLESSALAALGIFMSFVPDLLPKPEDLNELAWDGCMGATFHTWATSLDRFDVYIFNGEEKGVKDLASLIADGAMIAGSANGTEDPDKAQNFTQSFLDEHLTERAFFGASVPVIWSITGDNPVVLMTNYDCGTDNPLSPQYISEDTGPETWVCLPGENKIYYLVSAWGTDEDDCTQFPGNNVPCINHKFRAPRGLDKLDGKTWGNLTRDDLVVGAVNTYTANGGNKENGFDFNNKNTLAKIVENDIRAPGVTHIPVCTAQEAFANWVKGKKISQAKFYPCN